MFIDFSVLYNAALLILSRSIIYFPMNAKTTLLYISVNAVFLSVCDEIHNKVPTYVIVNLFCVKLFRPSTINTCKTIKCHYRRLRHFPNSVLFFA